MDVIGRDLMSSITFVIGATASGKSFYINEMFSQEDVDILNAYSSDQEEVSMTFLANNVALIIQ